MKKKAVIVSGYFNPIHKGHLEYFNNAKAMADELFVIVNNDHQRVLKGSREFQGEEERMIIVSNIKVGSLPHDCSKLFEVYVVFRWF